MEGEKIMGYQEIIDEEMRAINPDYDKNRAEFRKCLDISHALINRRIEMGLTKEELAETLGVSMEELHRLECGDFWESREDTERWINETVKMN